jgi:nucleoid DNA-binding protein
MNKLDLAAKLAKEMHRSRANAADAVDTLVHDMLTDLKQHSSLPCAKKAADQSAKRRPQSPPKTAKKKP